MTPGRKMSGHKGAVIWFTGLSGSGKSTLARAVNVALDGQGWHSFVLDGDVIRHGLCEDLGFDNEDRQENIRRIGEVARLFMEAGVIVLVACISPFQSDRDRVRSLFGKNEFLEVYCNASLAVCESRDVKGLYEKARRGEIKNFTGISSPYELPDRPDITVNSEIESLASCVLQVLSEIKTKGIIA